MTPELAKRIRKTLTFGNIYFLIGPIMLQATVPRENTDEKRSLRQFVDKICDNAPHRDWLGIAQFTEDANKICKNAPSWVKAELDEVIQALGKAIEETMR